MRVSTLFSLAVSLTTAAAYTVPSGLQTFYNNVKNGGCKSWLNGNNAQNDGYGKTGFGFCNDTPGIIYVSGPGSLADMDVDCDGSTICEGDGTWQGQTAFDWLLQDGYGLKTLEASKHTFVVLGTQDIHFDTVHGGPILPLSVVAIVCNGQLHYGIFGDTNGENSTGEASISLAQICFPNDGLNGNKGHTEHDVLYVAFTDPASVPGPSGANWKASDPKVFEASLQSLGDRMIANVFGGNGGGGGECEWEGHCAGAPCVDYNDCSDELTCVSGFCA